MIKPKLCKALNGLFHVSHKYFSQILLKSHIEDFPKRFLLLCMFMSQTVNVAELKLSPDVAGATFMAAGSSAPELATVVIGVFFAKDDIGISGVIGSAVFNIMFVISVCALCAGTVCHLNWWPLTRDCFFYALSILVMLFTISNEMISWYVWHLYSIFSFV